MSNDDKSFRNWRFSLYIILNECVACVSRRELSWAWLSSVYIQIQNQSIVIFPFIFGWFKLLLVLLLASVVAVVVYFRALLIRICSTHVSNHQISSFQHLVYFCHFITHISFLVFSLQIPIFSLFLHSSSQPSLLLLLQFQFHFWPCEYKFSTVVENVIKWLD